MSRSTSSSDVDLSVLVSPKSLSPRDYMNLLQCQGTPKSGCVVDDGAMHSKDDDDEDDLLKETEEDNRKREQEMWSMLAGQAAFKLESYIFHKVLPESLIKPHIFPRHVKDMQALIEKYTARGEAERLEGAAAKWEDLKTQWHWKREHAVALATVKCEYLHISKPLEVMMKLDKEQGDSVENARRAFRNSLLPQLHKAGNEIVDMMLSAGLLTYKMKESTDANTSDSYKVSRKLPRSAPVAVPGKKRSGMDNET